MELKIVIGAFLVLTVLYLFHLNRALTGTPEEARKFAQQRWTKEELMEEYARVQRAPTDVRKYLPPKQGRRYVVVGGSGSLIPAVHALQAQGTFC